MMTSTIASQAQQGQGRTVREIVEHSHEQVNETWCRKVFRQLLASLETQYAMHMPHRAITPETVVIQENGEPLLLPSPPGAIPGDEAADLHALGAVIHYAIMREWQPAAPLRPLGLQGYSDSLINAVDKCLSPDPRERPQTIDQLRNLLGIVALGPAVPAAVPLRTAPSPAPASTAAVAQPSAARAPLRGAPMQRLQRWVLIGVAVCVLMGAAIALLALLRGTGSDDAVALSLPPAERNARGLDANETMMGKPGVQHSPATAPAPQAPAAAPPLAAQPAPAAPSPAAPAPAPELEDAPLPPAASAPAAAPATAAAQSSTTYKLLIKPWGTVYVDGQDRGVSPPVKRLVLPAGSHTVRIVNPNYPDRVLRVDAGKRQSGTITHNFSSASR